MQKNYSIAAVILSCNAHDKIGNCLSSVIDWADEVIVVDGKSTDGTIEIAREHGACVYSHDFLGSFAQERNFGTQQAKAEWVLQLDSDEVVPDAFKKVCDAVLPVTECAAFKFHRKNVFLGHAFTHGGWYHWSQHLFKRNRAHYEGRVHEAMIVEGETGYLDADILHYPFDTITQFIDRQNRYTTLQAYDILDQDKDVTLRKVRYNITLRPFKLFRKMYFKKKGYKEGMHGFVFAILFSFVHVLKWAKVWEIAFKKPHETTVDQHTHSNV